MSAHTRRSNDLLAQNDQGETEMVRVYLFRWWRHWQLDVGWRDRGWLSIGLTWRRGLRPVFYLSPDATPQSATFSFNGRTLP